MVPNAAVEAEIRPPIFRYFSVPTKATNRTRLRRASMAAAISAPDFPASRRRTASRTSKPSPRVTFKESTRCSRSAPAR